MTLDAAHPLVLDTRPLRRRAGTMVKIERSATAPEAWEVSGSRVPPGSPVDLRLRLEAVVEGVLVSGTATVVTEGECSRCLDAVAGILSVPVQQLYEYADADVPAAAEDDDPMPRLDGDLLDLEPVLRDAVVLDLPQVPLCAPDCPGLCPVCGTRLADEPGHHHDEPDARWAALQGWLAGTDDTGAASTGVEKTEEKGD